MTWVGPYSGIVNIPKLKAPALKQSKKLKAPAPALNIAFGAKSSSSNFKTFVGAKSSSSSSKKNSRELKAPIWAPKT